MLMEALLLCLWRLYCFAYEGFIALLIEAFIDRREVEKGEDNKRKGDGIAPPPTLNILLIVCCLASRPSRIT